jgi:hypothetical protein
MCSPLISLDFKFEKSFDIQPDIDVYIRLLFPIQLVFVLSVCSTFTRNVESFIALIAGGSA